MSRKIIPQQLAPEDIYELRKVILSAKHKALEAQLADVEVGVRLLEIDKAYGLLDKKAEVNVDTGEITIKKEDKDEKDNPT